MAKVERRSCSLRVENGSFFEREGSGGLFRSQDSLLIHEETWLVAEQVTHQILSRIQPTVAAENKRRAIAEYIRSLIEHNVGCQILPYGSVPLKTYLCDGDIDFTVVCNPGHEAAFLSRVHSVLSREAGNRSSEFEVKEIHRINADVKLLKCLVGEVAVDITFNQSSGLCALCFLEMIDETIGKNHLFKRSIILIKAWCYYESRTLGAQYGLLSTYALEILVLCIINRFHSSLCGPISVLYRFLDYYSKFDWDNYCVSLNGPVAKFSQASALAEESGTRNGDLLLRPELIRNCVQIFLAEAMDARGTPLNFLWKYLNIIDPIKENNNLGRSVSRGSFFRICSAFKLGALKLGQILSSKSERIPNQLYKFFANTLKRNTGNFSSVRRVHFAVDINVASGTDTMVSSSLSNGILMSVDSDLLSVSSSDPYHGKAVSLASLSDDLEAVKILGKEIGHSSEGSGSSETLLDLAGDYSSHFADMVHCQCYHCFWAAQNDLLRFRHEISFGSESMNHLNAVKQYESLHRDVSPHVYRNPNAKLHFGSSITSAAALIQAPYEVMEAHLGRGKHNSRMQRGIGNSQGEGQSYRQFHGHRTQKHI